MIKEYSFFKLCLAIISSLFFLFINDTSASDFVHKKTPVSFEKMYLHIDKTYYHLGSTIYFQIYVINKGEKETTSQIATIDLMNSEGGIIDSKKIRLQKGLGEGSFQLPQDLPTGIFLLRGHTPALRNMGSKFFYREAIFVQGVQSSTRIETIQKNSKPSPSSTNISQEELNIEVQASKIRLSLKEDLPNPLMYACFFEGEKIWEQSTTGKQQLISVEQSKIPTGIVHFKVIEPTTQKVLSEKLFLNDNEIDNFNIDILMDREFYQPLQKVQLELDVYDDEGEALPSQLSISVVEQSFYPNTNDIRTQFFLHPYLGEYDKLSSDFIKKDWTALNTSLSAVSPYIWDNLSPLETENLKDNSLHISGRITEIEKSEKGIKGHGYLMDLSDPLSLIAFETDEKGYFFIDSLSIEGEQEMLIQAVKGKRKDTSKKNGLGSLKGNRRVAIHIDTLPTLEADQHDYLCMNNFVLDVTTISKLDKQAIPAASSDEWDGELSVTLDEIEIKEKRLDKQVTYYEKGMLYRRPNVRIKTMTMPTLNQYRNVYDVLDGRVPGMKLDAPEDPSMQHAVILRGRKTGLSKLVEMSNAAKFMVNGALVSTAYAESIHPSDIAFIDVLSSMDQLTAYGEVGSNGLIIIYLKTLNERTNNINKSNGGVFHFTFKGIAVPDRFPSSNNKDNYNTTLFWQPSIEINSSGSATVEFLTPNRAGVFDIIIQGINANGLPITSREILIVK